MFGTKDRLAEFFSTDFMVSVLRKAGYVVAEDSDKVWKSEYHNQVYEAYHSFLTVRTKKGKDFCKPHYSDFDKNRWVQDAFEEVLNKAILKIVSE